VTILVAAWNERDAIAVFGFMQRWQARDVFRTLDIHPQPDERGFLGHLLAYEVPTSAAALRGYCQYIVGSSRRGSSRIEGAESSGHCAAMR
jgi:hypothetical protein